jgi:hypothetical protein
MREDPLGVFREFEEKEEKRKSKSIFYNLL